MPPAISRPHRHLASIEVCRGIAAVMVVAVHSGNILSVPADFGIRPFGNLMLFGRSGVDFFFVLSGFLISLLHWGDIGRPSRLGRYVVRRVTRIYPTYWLVLVAVVPLDIFRHTLFDNYSQPWEDIKSILLLPQRHTMLDVTWSLRNELLFYLLFGLAIFNRWLGLILVGLWIVVLLVTIFMTAPVTPIENIWIYVATFPMNFEFLAGVAAGWAFPRLSVPRPALLLGLGLAGFIVLWVGEDLFWWTYLPLHLLVFRCLAYAAAAVSVLMGLSTLEQEGRVRMPRFLITLGAASYLLYLIHVPVLLFLGATERHVHWTRFGPPWLFGLIFDLSVIVGAVLLHLWVEMPMLRAIRGFRSDPPKRETAAPV